MAEALLGLGGNIGDVRATLDRGGRAVRRRHAGETARALVRLFDPALGRDRPAAFRQLRDRGRDRIAAPCAADPRARCRARARPRPRARAALGTPRNRHRSACLWRCGGRRAGSDVAPPAPVRTGVRAGAARRDRAGSRDRRDGASAMRARRSTPTASCGSPRAPDTAPVLA